MLDRLFKRTATGAIQVWDIELEANTGRYRMISGKLDGKLTTSEWTVPKPKNVGRANATTAAQQGALEVQAAWEKKKRDGYSETADAARESATFKCMLAQHYSDPKRKAEALAAAGVGQLYSQPKLDGIRCLASRHGLMSRTNRPITSCPHIMTVLTPLFKAYPDAIIDGELFNYELRANFNKITSMVTKDDPTPEQLAEIEQTVQFWVYDGLHLGAPADAVFSLRHLMLVEEIEGWAQPAVNVLPTHKVTSEEEIDQRYSEYLESGDEGQMLRIDESYDGGKKSKYLLKRKEHEDQEFTVLDIVEGEGNRSGGAGFVWVQLNKEGKKCKANVKGDDDFRKELLENKNHYIGGQVTIRFNAWTPDGSLRFPRALHDKWYPLGRTM